MNIILSGFMGSGKTTIANILSKKLNMKFIDLDKFIQQKSGMTISQIFEMYSENKFRQLEANAVDDICKMDGYVIATGGGTLLNSENMRKLRLIGKVIFLDVSVETILRRLANDQSRPLISLANKENAISQLLMGRLPIYKAAADFSIDANDDNAENTVQQIIDNLYIKQD